MKLIFTLSLLLVTSMSGCSTLDVEARVRSELLRQRCEAEGGCVSISKKTLQFLLDSISSKPASGA